jgi:hypothetical protein
MSVPKRSYMDIYQELSPAEKVRLIRRFLALRTIDDRPDPITGTPCWTSTNRNGKGYGYIQVANRTLMAHRLAVVLRGHYDDPELVAHHVCERGAEGCINPAHVEFITDGENIKLGRGVSAVNALKIECARGHLLAGDTIRITATGKRRCLRCDAAQKRRHRARQHQAIEVAKYNAAVARGETPDAVVIRMGSLTPSTLPPLPAHLPPFDVAGVA